MINTYQNALKLYGNAYLKVLPFTLLAVAVEYAYLKYGVPITATTMAGNEIEKVSNNAWLVYGASSAIYAVIISFVYAIAFCIIERSGQGQAFNYADAVKKGIERTMPLIQASLILLSPLLILLLISSLYSYITIQHFWNIFHVMYFVGFGFILLLIPYVYFYVISALVVVREKSALEGLKQSWQLTRGHWWKTFSIIVILSVISFAIDWILSKFIDQYSQQIVKLLVFPLGIALILTHYHNLENAYQANTVSKI